MPCLIPLSNKNQDISFFALRPLGVFAEELINALKHFSFHAESLGCLHSAVLKSIHGNLVVWYGVWIKRSTEDREALNSILESALSNITNISILLHHGFFDVYVGESKQVTAAARFSSSNAILLSAMVPTSLESESSLTYACLALRSIFSKVGGVSTSVCFRCQDQPVVLMFQVWDSLQACYSWLLHSDYRKTTKPFISMFTDNTQFDIFKVVYISKDEVLDTNFYSSPAGIAGPARSI